MHGIDWATHQTHASAKHWQSEASPAQHNASALPPKSPPAAGDGAGAMVADQVDANNEEGAATDSTACAAGEPATPGGRASVTGCPRVATISPASCAGMSRGCRTPSLSSSVPCQTVSPRSGPPDRTPSHVYALGVVVGVRVWHTGGPWNGRGRGGGVAMLSWKPPDGCRPFLVDPLLVLWCLKSPHDICGPPSAIPLEKGDFLHSVPRSSWYVTCCSPAMS